MEHKGFIAPEKIETLEEGAQHVLGSAGLPGVVINPTGDWVPYRGPFQSAELYFWHVQELSLCNPERTRLELSSALAKTQHDLASKHQKARIQNDGTKYESLKACPGDSSP